MSKKTVFTIIFFIISLNSYAANRYYVGTGGFNSTARWSTSSGGAGGASIPGSNDVAIFDANSGNCSIDVNVNVRGINTTGYTWTITQNSFTISVGSNDLIWVSGTFSGSASNISCNGNFSLSGGNFTATSGTLSVAGNFSVSGGIFTHNNGTTTITAASTITNGSFYNLILNGNVTFTITNNTIVANTLTLTTLSNLNGSPIEVRGNLVLTDGSWSGTSKIIINGTGAQSISGAGVCGVPLDVNKASGTMTLAANLTLQNATSNFSLIAGTVNCATFTLIVPGSFSQSAGSFLGGTNTITITGAFSITGGTFTSTSGNLALANTLSIATGAFTHNSGTVTLTAATLTITDGAFNNLILNNTAQVVTLTNNCIVNGNLTLSAIATLNGSPVEVKGNLILTDTTWSGSSKMILNGTGAQTSSGAGVCGVTLEVNKSSGTYTLGANLTLQNATSDFNLLTGSVNCVTYNLTIPRNFSQSAGTFTGGSGSISITGTFTISAGTFTSTSGSLSLANSISIASSTFSHNSGTVILTAAAVTVVDGNFFNLTLNNASQVLTVTNNMVVNGNLTVTALLTLNGSAVEVRGNITFTDAAWSGTSKIVVNGSNAQTITGAGVCGVSMDINKATGTATLASATSLAGTTSDLNLILGTLNCSSFNLTLPRNLVVTGGTFQPSTGTVIYTGSAVTITNGNFYKLQLNLAAMVATISGNCIVTNTMTIAALTSLNGSSIEARGNVVFTDTSWNGTSKLIINGTGAQSISGAGVCGVSLDVNKSAGTVTLASATSLAGTSSDLSLISGTFNCSSFNLTLPRNLVITGGTFQPGTGTVIYTGSTVTITNGSFYNLQLNASAMVATVSNNSIVSNTLTFTALTTLNGSAIEARGNIVFTDTSWNGSSKIIINGTGAQNCTGAGVCGVPIEINKTTGSFDLAANLTLSNTSDFTMTSGTFNANTFVLTLPRNLINSGGTFNSGTGTVIFNGATASISNATTFYNLTLNSSTLVMSLTSNSIVINTFTVTALATINGSNFELRGNMVFTDTSWNGTSSILINGNLDQNVSGTGDMSKVEINKSAGNLIFNSSVVVSRSWSQLAGNIVWNSNTVTFNSAAATITSGSFNNLTLNNSTQILTLINNSIVSGTLTLTAIATINGNSIEARGNIVFTDTSWNGTSSLLVNGITDQNISGIGDVSNFEINKSTGNLIFNNSVLVTRNWIHTAGSIIWNNNSVTFNGATTSITNGSFYNLILNAASQVMTITNNVVVSNTLTLSAINTINGSAIEARGDLVFTDTSWLGTSKIIANGTGNQNISGTGNASDFEINKSSGNLIVNSSFNISKAWTHTAGAITWNNNSITLNGASTSITSGNFYDVILNAASLVITNNNNMTITNNLTITNLLTFNGSPISVAGNVSFLDNSWDGNGKIIFNGTSNQTISGSGVCGSSLEINNASGSIDLISNLTQTGATSNLKVISGTLNLNGFNLTVPDLFSVYSKLKLKGNENITVNSIANSVAFTNPNFTISATSSTVEFFDSAIVANISKYSQNFYHLILGSDKTHEVNVGLGNGLTVNGVLSTTGTNTNKAILRSAADAASDWYLNLTGSSTLADSVSVKRSNASAGNEVFAINSTNNGNNSNWIFSGPTITRIDGLSANGTYGIGSSISIRLQFSQTITLNGTMTLQLDSGGTLSILTFSGTSVDGSYIVASNQNSSDLSVNAISVNGSAKDGQLNNLDLNLPSININVNKDIIIDTTAPTITAINTDKANGSYTVSENININIYFSEAITVTTSLNISLDSGALVSISAFSGTSATGIYTVNSGQLSADLTVSNITVTGTARDIAQNNLVLTLPISNLGSNSNIVIDTTPPTITAINTSKPNGSYTTGENINLRIFFSEIITISTALNITLDTGAIVTVNAFSGTSASGVYTVAAGQTTSDLTVTNITVTGTARDIAQNNLVLTLPTSNLGTTSNIVIDTTIPTISSISSSKADGIYSVGEQISMSINFTEPITANSGLQIQLDTGGLVSIGAFTGITAFGTYTVLAGHNSTDLNVTAITIVGTAKDTANNNLNTSLPINNLGTNSNIQIDTNAANISSISSNNANGVYSVGSAINIVLNFSESVTLTGTLTVNLNSGGNFILTSFTGTSAIGVYTVQSGQISSDLNVISFSLQGAFVDAGLNSVIQTLPVNNLSQNKDIVIDTIMPQISAFSSANIDGDYGVSASLNISLHFNESITLTGTISVTLSSGGQFEISNFTGTNASGVYTVLAGENSNDLSITGVTINGTALDLGSNALDVTLPLLNLSDSREIKIDTTSPIITGIYSLQSDGAYKAGTLLQTRVDFSEPITLVGTMSVNLDSGGQILISTFSGTNAFGVYTVLSGHNSPDLNVTAITVFGTASDNVQNILNLSLPSNNLAITSTLIIDTTIPNIQAITSNTINGSYSVGSNINIQLNFSENVVLSGSLTINLDTGGQLVLNTINGTNAIGIYTILPGQNSNDLTVNSLNLVGTLTDVAGNALTVSIPSANLGINKDIIVDTIAPSVVSVNSTNANGSYKAGATIQISLSFSEVVTLNGTMSVQLDSGGTFSISSFTGNSATGVYTVSASQNSNDLRVTSISYSGLLRDIANNNIITTVPANNLHMNSNIIIDTVAPTIASFISTTPNGTYGTGQNINITLNFNENVTLAGVLTLNLNSGAVVVINSLTNNNQAIINYVVGGSDSTTDLSVSAIAVSGNLTDLAGNAISVALPSVNISTNSDIVISTIAPVITSITSSSADGVYSTGSNIQITLNFSRSITLIGTLTLNLDSGGIVQIPSFNNQTQISGNYLVALGHNSIDLNVQTIGIVGSALDAVNVPLSAGLPLSNLSINKNIIVDAQGPIIQSASSANINGVYGIGSNITVQLQFNEPVTLIGTMSIALDSGGVVLISSFTNATTASGVYTVLNGHMSNDLNISSVTLTGTCKDIALNDITLSLPVTNLSVNNNIVIDTNAANCSSIIALSNSGTYRAGQNISIQLNFNEQVILNGLLKINLTSDGTLNINSFSGTSAIGVYTIANGENTNVLNVTSLSLLSGTFTDLASNSVSVGLPSTNISPARSIIIDTTAPMLLSNALGVSNAYIDIAFSEPVYSTNSGSGILDANDFVLVFNNNGGTASSVAINQVVKTNGAPLLGGESNFRLSLTISGNVKGVETINVSLENNAIFDLPGNAASLSSTGNVTLFDTLSPSVINVASATPNGNYKSGSNILINITFSENVLVTGLPSLILETGAIDRLANYVSGSGSNILQFSYQVQPGDSSDDLDYSSTSALQLNNGSIKDILGNAASLVLPVPSGLGSISNQQNIVIDTAKPMIINGSIGPNNATIDVVFSESVFTSVAGGAVNSDDFTLTLNPNGGNIVSASILSLENVSGGNLVGGETVIRVRLRVSGPASGSETISINVIANEIYDKAGNTIVSPATTGTITFNSQGTVPTIKKVFTESTNGTYYTGSILKIGVQFTEPVIVSGAPGLLLETGNIDRYAIYNTGTGTDTLIFVYGIQDGDSSNDLSYIDSASLVSGAQIIKGLTGISAQLTLPVNGSTGSLSETSDIKIDTSKLLISKISTTVASGSYTNGFNIPIDIQISKPVTLTGGSLTVALSSGRNIIISQHKGNTIRVNYLIGTGESAKLLDVVSLTLSESAHLLDETGVELPLLLPSENISANSQIQIQPAFSEYTVNTSMVGIGTISPEGISNVKSGSNIGYQFSAGPGHYIKDVIVDGESVGAVETYALINVTKNHQIHVVFQRLNNTFVVTSNAGIGGKITPSGVVSINDGSDLKFDIIPEVGYHISSIKVNNTAVSLSSSLSLTNIQKDYQIFVYFAKDQSKYLVTSNILGSGTISPLGHQYINDGADVTYRITPESGFHIREIFVDGESLGALSEYTFANVLDNHIITAVFEKTQASYQISAYSIGKGQISMAGIKDVLPGESILYTFLPQKGHHISNVIIDGVSIGAKNQYMFTNVNENHSIVVSFHETKITYPVNSSVVNGGINSSIVFNNSSEVIHGGSLSFTVIAQPGYKIGNVKANGQFLFGENKQALKNKTMRELGSSAFFTVSPVLEDLLLEVNYEKVKLEYTFSVNILGKGKADLGTNAVVEKGTNQTITFIAEEGYRLGDVLVDNVSIGPVAYLSFANVDQNHELLGVFVKDSVEYKINSSVTGKGAISPSGESKVAKNTNMTYLFEPDNGYLLSDVILNGSSVKNAMGIGNRNSLLISNVTMDHQLEAVFTRASYSYTVQVNVYGSGLCDKVGRNSVEVYGDFLMKFTPENGHHVSDVIVNGKSIGAVTAYQLQNIISEQQIDVHFVKDATQFKILVDNQKNGKVEPATDIDVIAGEDQFIRIIPNDHFRVLDVMIDGKSQGPISSYLFKSVQKDMNVSVVYAEEGKAFSINSSVKGDGVISPSGLIAIGEGESVIYTIRENQMGVLSDVKVDGISMGAISSFTFTDVKENHTIIAYYDVNENVNDGAGAEKNSGCQFVANAPINNLWEIILLLLSIILITRLIKKIKSSKQNNF